MPGLKIHNTVDGWDLKVPFQGKRVSIGSDSGNTICLQGDGVSPHHFLLYQNNGDYRLRNLNGSEGTTVDGEVVTEDADLGHGTEIVFGPFRIVYENGQVPAKTAKPNRKPKTYEVETRVPKVEAHSDTAKPAAEVDLGFDLPDDLPDDPPAAPADELHEEFDLPAEKAMEVEEPATTAGSGTERRKWPRTEMGHIRCEMRPAGLLNSLGMGAAFPVRVVDLSERGIKLVATVPIDKKQEYSLKLTHIKHGDVHINAHIVWEEKISHRTNYGEEMHGMVAGLKFSSDGKKQSLVVREFMEKKSKAKEGTTKVRWR